MIRNYTPHQRHDPWERRPITHEGGEVFTVGERRYPGWLRVLIALVGSGICWALILGFVLMVATVARGLGNG